jgi:hypothetical protein
MKTRGRMLHRKPGLWSLSDNPVLPRYRKKPWANAVANQKRQYTVRTASDYDRERRPHIRERTQRRFAVPGQ